MSTIRSTERSGRQRQKTAEYIVDEHTSLSWCGQCPYDDCSQGVEENNLNMLSIVLSQ
jgi:hypothetical protein